MPQSQSSGRYKIRNPSKYVGTRQPVWRSTWELVVCKMLDNHPGVQTWASESIKIPYRCPVTGKATVYVPDFFVVYIDKKQRKRAELLEVKPAKYALTEKAGDNLHNKKQLLINYAKWEAAKKWCKQYGIIFRVVTEDQIFHKGTFRHD